ncbi:hypothetical protein EG329_006056 [Mollisiaceae sp. DMI_Dod_QoI]|nr:hypothetical protein EG329_006056 [Helotiales sp. DMI_Dod_QoI]
MLPAYRAAAGESGTGKAARQRAIVQGRITNGILFPHISAKIQANIDQLVQKTFRNLHDAVNAVLDLIVSDIEIALVSRPQGVDDARNQESPEEERRKGELMVEIRELKGKHEELLASISNM